jgi:ADP-heptose:LPS heptosyltransferase
MEKIPRYFVLPEERVFQLDFWRAHGLEGRRVVGIQLRAEELYRDYPHMRQLVARIAQDHQVLLFDAEKIDGCDEEGVTKVEGLRMREAFALASACDAIIAPDSAFVHLAAAFDIPCVALYGPIDSRTRTWHYPKCRPLDVRATLGCQPCWRNDHIPCKLTNMRSSICMANISPDTILTTLEELLR